jgi:haloalkane dehalogenase
MEQKKINVLGKEIAYLEGGEGDPIVFQHGNPTCAYVCLYVAQCYAPP